MSKARVLLDPGHGGIDPGAVYHGLNEKDLNLMLALKVAGRLSELNIVLTRDRDVYVSLADRVALSKRTEPDLFLSLHANAGGGHGFESFIFGSISRDDPVRAMQTAVHNEIMAALADWQIRDRGRKAAAFYVLRNNPFPALLIESLFIDNRREADLWREPLFVETLADGIAGGVRKALGLAEVQTKPHPGSVFSKDEKRSSLVDANPVDVSSETLPNGKPNIEYDDSDAQAFYTVQVGAFAYIENARQRLAEAQRAGFSDAFIYRKGF